MEKIQNKDIWPVIVRYLDDTMDDKDSARLEEWLEEGNENRKILHSVSQIWKASEERSHDSLIQELNLEKDWERIACHIEKTDAEKKNERILKYKRLRRRQQIFSNLLKAAALVLVAFTSGYLTLQYAPAVEDQEYKPVFNEIRTSAGERANVDLGDGSKVTLNAASKLIMPETFSRQAREVELHGQAYFDIESDKNRPFYIHTQSGVVEVVGTAFDVRSYSEETQFNVVVRKGTVEISHVEDPANKLIVNEGYKGSITVADSRMKLEWVTEPERYFGWLEGRLIFKEEYLSDVFKQIERWYDVQIEVAESDSEILQKQFSADLKTRSVREVMDVIQKAMDIEYRIEDNRILISSGSRSISSN